MPNLIFTVYLGISDDITIKQIKQIFIDKLFEKYGKQIDDINKVGLIMGGKLLDNDDIGIYTYQLCTFDLHIRVYYSLSEKSDKSES